MFGQRQRQRQRQRSRPRAVKRGPTGANSSQEGSIGRSVSSAVERPQQPAALGNSQVHLTAVGQVFRERRRRRSPVPEAIFSCSAWPLRRNRYIWLSARTG